MKRTAPSLSFLATLSLATALVGAPLSAAEPAAKSASPAPALSALTGRVVLETVGAPISQARVFAYELATFSIHEVATDRQGQFRFRDLPAGMYKLIAFKPGFQPVVELLLRRSSDLAQQVDLKLRVDSADNPVHGEDYWSVRGKVPADVLRQLQGPSAFNAEAEGLQLANGALFAARMDALSGVAQIGPALEAAQRSAEVGLLGAIGDVQIGLNGRFADLLAKGEGPAIDGASHSVDLKLQKSNDQLLRLTATGAQLDLPGGAQSRVDLEHYQIDWKGRTGARGETQVVAAFTNQANYWGGLAKPQTLLGSSEMWSVNGSHQQALSERTSLEAGLKYSQRSFGTRDESADERLGLFGKAGTKVNERVLVEYGLYSSVRDGSLSLMPHGGFVIQLKNDWKAEASIARRVESGETQLPGFSNAYHADGDACHEAASACYSVSFTQGEGDRSVRVGALHREFAETLQLYFSPDFFERLESVFMVEGDSLPELQFSLVRRIAPRILAKLESNLSSGGGGVFYATDEKAYENQVRYLVTSLDTRFQRTQTGVFVSFHHLEQSFNKMDKPLQADVHALELQRLQLMLTQDLSVLADLASNWAFRLNMELSRGTTPYSLTADDELYKKLTGGFSVSF